MQLDEATIKRKNTIASLLGILLTGLSSLPCPASPKEYTCTAWGGSHTGKYTFVIDTQKCEALWVEIGKSLKVATCNPPNLIAIKPFAPAKGYILKFNLETGTFSDHVPGWADRGTCTLKR